MIQRSDIKKIAEAARLAITAEEEVEYQEYMIKMLSNFTKLESVNTQQVEEKIYSIPMENVLRADEIKPSLAKEQALRNAPDPIKGYFRVPRIMEE